MIKIDLEKKQPIQELSAVIQGEGSLMGIPHLLIRLSGCRLRCQFADSFCDTWMSSWKPRKGTFSLQDVIDFSEKFSHISHVFITGGGPTLHKELLPELVELCKNLQLYVTIETEGSEYVDTGADLISLSPKFSNSTPRVGSIKPWDGSLVTEKDKDQHEKWRRNYPAMKALIERQIVLNRDFQLKPVISTPEDLEELKYLQATLSIPNHKVWLMPEGTEDELLQKKRQWLFDICIKEGYNYTDRLHIIAYGNIEGV